jgi:hypothetical protein
MQTRRDLFVFQRENRFDKTSYTCGSVKVSDIGFY